MPNALEKVLIIAALAVPACHTMVPLTFEGWLLNAPARCTSRAKIKPSSR